MTPQDIVLTVIIALAIGGACFYVYREKKKGKRCVGCPYSDSCSSRKPCQCNKSEDEVK